MKRILMFALTAAVLWTAENWWLNTQQADLSVRLALNQVNGGQTAARALRAFQCLKDSTHIVAGLLTLFAAILILGPLGSSAGARLRKLFGRGGAPVLLAVLLASTSGCLKPYDRPEYVEIDTSETGFLIPLEGDTAQQAKFQSEGYLLERKVAAKRVQITHRWSQEGRWPNDGRWIPTVRLVKVNRSPVTREWSTPEAVVGKTTQQAADTAIWIESGDSVGFSLGFTCTAFISEEDAAKFLYWYPSGSLADVMDREARGRIQQVAAEVAARYPLDALRSRKQEISDAVRQDLTNHFAARGITVTTIGMFGGMSYENPAIQRSIDETFIAQQLKVVVQAKFEAQKRENERIELEANGAAERVRREAQGQADARLTAAKAEADARMTVARAEAEAANSTADRARREAQGEADARLTTAKAEAESIRAINAAAQQAQGNPLLLQLKSLDVEKARIERWDGRYPQWWMAGPGASGGPNLMFQVPLPASSKN
jgi:hypothetical protein